MREERDLPFSPCHCQRERKWPPSAPLDGFESIEPLYSDKNGLAPRDASPSNYLQDYLVRFWFSCSSRRAATSSSVEDEASPNR